MKNPTKITATIKSFDKELSAILEKDIRKFTAAKDLKIKNAAFLQLIAA